MAGFFIACSFLDVIEVEELLLRRYANIAYIFDMPPRYGLDFLKKAREKEAEERIWSAWVACYPDMTKDSFVSFEDFKDDVTGKNICRLSAAEILEMAESIEAKCNRNRGDRIGC